MKMVLGTGIFCVLVAASLPALAAERKCPIPGTRTHWAADFCMATLETDDEIPAGECIGTEHRRRFRDDCEAKRHYKREMCRLAVERRIREDGIEGCLADPKFVGPTVRNRGVGGRVQ